MQFFALLIAIAALLPAFGQAPATQPSSPRKNDSEMAYYLFAYFKDDTHSLYMALSKDGYAFTDINNAQPIMDGTKLAEQKGIRDPHIVRGPDGAFYLAMTDLHLFGKQKGFRDTEWERPGDQFGWGNNRGFVFMKSKDLINWSHSIFRMDKAFPELGPIGCTWAPETIFDEEKGKMMVYFTMRLGNGKTKLYYAYADDAFTKLETKPELLFTHPDERVQILDADITKVNGRFHMFYVSQERNGGIKQAVSDKIKSGYVYDKTKYDPEKVACEAPNVWRRLGTDTYVLMYDIFGIKPHNFGFSETTDFVNFKNLGRFNEGTMKATNFASPKHGAIIHITAAEAKILAEHWKFDLGGLK